MHSSQRLSAAAEFYVRREMKRFSYILLGTSAILGVGLIALSLRPSLASRLFDLAFFTALFWVPAFCIAGIVVFVLLVRSLVRDWKQSMPVVGLFLLSGIVGVVCLIIAVSGVPRRIAFRASVGDFRSLCSSAQESEYMGNELNRRIGVWTVDRYAADPRGGVFFRTGTAMDGISPDTMSYGFAYRPNTNGTPFGNAKYWISEVAPDWYHFRVSNDW